MSSVMRIHSGLGIAAFLSCSVVLFSFNYNTEDILNGRLKKIGDALISSSFQEGLHMVDRAIAYTMKRNRVMDTLSSPIQMLSFLKRAEPESQEISRAAEIWETTLQLVKERIHQKHKRSINATDLLSTDELKMIADMSGCLSHLQPPICPKHCLASKYRTITGACNNRNNRRWGASNSALARWLPAQYEDGYSQPKSWNPGHLYNGFELPPVREISNKIFRASDNTTSDDNAYTRTIVEWGQYIDHDISFTPQSTSKATFKGGLDCRHTCENLNPCFPIKIPPNDTFSTKKDCLPFYRSSPACGTGEQVVLFETLTVSNQRQQINALTSFIDGSTVYGSTPALENELRNLTSEEGLLNVNTRFSDNGREFLPFVAQVPSPCAQDLGDPDGVRIECFLAGDSRSNEVISLSALHTLWVREHNRIARTLKKLNTHWSAETAYQEARKIVGALHQIITMRDYVPKIIGISAFHHYIGPYGGYDPSINPTVSNVFSTAAFRFGHATIPPVLQRLHHKFQEHKNLSSLSLHEAFFSPWRLIKEGGLDPVIRGLLSKPATLLTPDHIMSKELTEKLFVLSNPGALDLASLNLQRGRDHGLPGYNDWREFCGLHRLETQASLSTVITDLNLVQKIIDAYSHPNNIDVWLGGLVEDTVPGARTGPLFACLIGKQMKNLRDGDRFWWESDNIFTESQRNELAKHSLSHVICDNSGVTEVQTDVFKLGQYPQDFVSCNHIQGLNLEAWQENPNRVGTCNSPPRIKNGNFVLCTMSAQIVVVYSCYFGYKLKGSEEMTCTDSGWSSDPPICKDINECEDLLKPVCHRSAKCKNTNGSYRCLCSDPYVLAEDGRTCIDSGKLPKGSVASVVLAFVALGCFAALFLFAVRQW
ncbi:thyroid peroxidase [Acipenser oxyrinchus oxyrinchus]|uniref:Thyroid peroxidase n=1 Tax=Acipenser oxyrinchus oxyrinchus TaxID=40147 RepID=A0AAD8GAC3_ACIOX|nr:thyroid peroxidase [Acipenser oxyrinchus oxyrinchus]